MIPSTKKKIAVIGSNMVDLVTRVTRMPVPGETLEAPHFEIGCGGKGANQAVAAARLGAEVMMLTCVGDDVFADNTLANLQRHGVDTQYVRRVAGQPSGVAPIFVEPSGENAILIVKGANASLGAADIERAADALKSCRLILLQLEVPLESVDYALAFAARHGIETILNPAPAAAGLVLEAMARATFLVPNETELAALTGMPVDTDAAIVSAARSLIARGVRTVIVTLGARGARLVTADGVVDIAPVDVRAQDTSGAGDAFIGAFARFYVEGGDVLPALRQAARYAADSVTRAGTQKSYASAEAFAAFCRQCGA